MPAGYDVRGTAEFRRTAAKLKTAGAGQLRREMTKQMRTAAHPAIDAAQDNIRDVDSQGVRGRGGQQRREYTLERSKSQSERVKKRAAEGRGLRATIARAVRLTSQSTGSNASVRIEVNSKLLPNDQRELPFYINAGQWRHPVFGNRHSWVTQTATPRGWFDRAMRAHGGRVRQGARSALASINRKIAE